MTLGIAWRLVVQEPGGERRTVRLDDEASTVVGRAPGETGRVLVLADPYASKRHLVLRSSASGLVGEDLGSSNGVLCNGRKITQASPLEAGDLLRVGRTDLRVECEVTAGSSGISLGPTIDGRYHVERELSRSELATVYRVRSRDGGLLRALKLVELEQEAAALHLQREIRLLRRLSHPHLVRIEDAGEEDKRVWLATGWIAGGTLYERVSRQGPLGEAEVRILASQLLGALGAAHAIGVIHRDVKPDNVLLDARQDGPWAVLADFGLAAPTSSDTPSRFTTTGSAKGTPRYMAPEQLRDAKRAGGAADQYGLAATLYHALCGEWHLRSTGRGFWVDVLEAPVVPLQERRSDVTAAFARWLERALARDAAQRYASIGVMQRALGNAVAGAG